MIDHIGFTSQLKVYLGMYLLQGHSNQTSLAEVVNMDLNHKFLLDTKQKKGIIARENESSTLELSETNVYASIEQLEIVIHNVLRQLLQHQTTINQCLYQHLLQKKIIRRPEIKASKATKPDIFII